MKTPEQLRAWRAEWRKPKQYNVVYGPFGPGQPFYEPVFTSVDALLRHREEQRRLSEQRMRDLAGTYGNYAGTYGGVLPDPPPTLWQRIRRTLHLDG